MIQEIVDKKQWEQFLAGIQDKSFLQSWNWGEFNARREGKIFRLGIYDAEKLVGVALLVKVVARRGSFIFCPHGPLLADWSQKKYFEDLVEYLKNLGKKEGVTFVRISPFIIDNDENKRIFKKNGFRPAPIHMHAELSWILDLAPREEDLLRDMRKTHRNLIRRAEKEGVTIRQNNSLEAVKLYDEIQCDTVAKHHFIPYSLEYFKTEFECLAPDNEVVVWQAIYDNKVIASALVVYHDKTGYYHHGAMRAEYSKLPATYLLQWTAINEAKRRGCQLYNFWGIASRPDHPWWGTTLFKQGFGGYAVNYLHAQDLILSYKYWLTWIVEYLRRKKRGL